MISKPSTLISELPSRRFGRTEIKMPVLSLGGMRFQQSWTDINPGEITLNSQDNLETTLQRAKDCGVRHIETARHYGSSELQIGWACEKFPDANRLLQTKVPPSDDPKLFEKELELSFEKLGCKRLDLMAIHGLNLPEHLDWIIDGEGKELIKWAQEENLIGQLGFSSHGSYKLILVEFNTQ